MVFTTAMPGLSAFYYPDTTFGSDSRGLLEKKGLLFWIIFAIIPLDNLNTISENLNVVSEPQTQYLLFAGFTVYI